MASVGKWLKIIGRILILIGGGMSKPEAVSKAASEFGISESDIWSHGGF
ncbi:hypothetical protein AB2T85_20620 [Clostridium butyricum]